MLGSLFLLLLLFTGGELPTLHQGPSWTPPPPLPTPSATPATTHAPPQRGAEFPFLPGDAVQNASGGLVNLRRSPGYRNKPEGDVIATIPAGTTGTVVGGPQMADGLRWWQVNFPDYGEGWMAEYSSSGLVLLDLKP